MKLFSSLIKLYSSEPINIGIKSKNLAMVLLVVGIVCLIMIPTCLIKGQTRVLLVIVVCLSFTVFSYILLFRKNYSYASSLYFIMLGFLPFLLALSQESIGYRDVYLYFFFCAPFIVLITIAGYKRGQVVLTGSMQIIFAYIYSVIRVFKIPGIDFDDVFFSLVIGTAFQIMIISFLIISMNVEKKIITTLEASSNETKVRLGQLENLIKNTGSVLESVQTVSSSLSLQSTEITNAAKTTTEMSKSMLAISDQAKNRSESISLLASTIETTRSVFEKNLDALHELKKSSAEVFNVISVIESITSQTNLLAINAGIEASHAGEFGKSFAVVAKEIRTLAEKTNESSGKIRAILDKNNKDLMQVDSGILESVEKFNNISKLSGEVKETLGVILEGSSGASDSSVKISSVIAELEKLYEETDLEMSNIAKTIDLTNNEIKALM